MRETHLIDPMNDYIPDPPEVNDMVRVYAAENSEYFIIGIVREYYEKTELYTIDFYNRGGDPDRMTVDARLVELDKPHQVNR